MVVVVVVVVLVVVVGVAVVVVVWDVVVGAEGMKTAVGLTRMSSCLPPQRADRQKSRDNMNQATRTWHENEPVECTRINGAYPGHKGGIF